MLHSSISSISLWFHDCCQSSYQYKLLTLHITWPVQWRLAYNYQLQLDQEGNIYNLSDEVRIRYSSCLPLWSHPYRYSRFAETYQNSNLDCTNAEYKFRLFLFFHSIDLISFSGIFGFHNSLNITEIIWACLATQYTGCYSTFHPTTIQATIYIRVTGGARVTTCLQLLRMKIRPL